MMSRCKACPKLEIKIVTYRGVGESDTLRSRCINIFFNLKLNPKEQLLPKGIRARAHWMTELFNKKNVAYLVVKI